PLNHSCYSLSLHDDLLLYLTSLTTLDVSGTSLTALPEAIGNLTSLTTLDISHTQITDLSGLLKLPDIQKITANKCILDCELSELWLKPSLQETDLYQTEIPGIPIEVLSSSDDDNCIGKLQAHLRDARAGSESVRDVKFMILGNGRVGKTQICRRLRGEAFDRSVGSTHGIQVTSAPLATPSHTDAAQTPATLRIWDFGGQDIYHGTHTLFLKSRAIFPLVWAPEVEKLREHQHGGFTFRNQPLGYWLAYVRAFGHKAAPILIIQARCDIAGYEREVPLEAGQLDEVREGGRRLVKTLVYSAATERGRAALDEALLEAAEEVFKHQGAHIGVGRAKVKERLEKLQDAGRQLLPRAEFDGFCNEAGNISSKDHFLDYLHNTGAVFYRKGLFGDRILLDQAWALDAIYAVFNREKSFGKLLRPGLLCVLRPFGSEPAGKPNVGRRRRSAVQHCRCAQDQNLSRYRRSEHQRIH
ncbi:MAG: leucine-rich repeat domain-containing protein, partial [Pseudomonadota bacterium]